MRFVSLRELRINPARMQEALEMGEEVILTKRGRPFAVITGVEEECLEDTLAHLRRARAQTAVSRMRKRAVERGLHRMTQEEIEALIAESRRERK